MTDGTKGWFIAGGRRGDRTFAQQRNGLDRLFASVAGKTVLDVGCAEGLIATALADAGARYVLGAEIVPGHVELARRLSGKRAVGFEVADANVYEPPGPFDIVLMLAVLHKLQDPSESARRIGAAAQELCVVRLPPYGSTIVDSRSFNVPHDIEVALGEVGLRLDSEDRGPFDEWVGYFVRV